jgi:hypothetical protein
MPEAEKLLSPFSEKKNPDEEKNPLCLYGKHLQITCR